MVFCMLKFQIRRQTTWMVRPIYSNFSDWTLFFFIIYYFKDIFNLEYALRDVCYVCEYQPSLYCCCMYYTLIDNVIYYYGPHNIILGCNRYLTTARECCSDIDYMLYMSTNYNILLLFILSSSDCVMVVQSW